MSEAFIQLMAEHRRLVILRALASDQTAGKANDSILHTIVVDRGVQSSRDQIKAALSWLKDQGMVTLKTLESGTFVATITQTGLDVACGNAIVPGVQRPSPGA
jgi:Fe2+ or Zn2+ uptake regulation protein